MSSTDAAGRGRRAIEIEGFGHHNPIPAASRVGPLLVSSMVVGYDHGTTDVPASAEAQVRNVFAHAHAILAAGGAGWGDVVRMTFYVPDLAQRAAVNDSWLEHFPDSGSRPARITHWAESALGIRAELIAYVQSGGHS